MSIIYYDMDGIQDNLITEAKYIKLWLTQNNIYSLYGNDIKILKDGSVNIHGDLNLITPLRIKINKIFGNFTTSIPQKNGFHNFPKYIQGNFKLYHNDYYLESLYGLEDMVIGGDFITSAKICISDYIPMEIKGNIKMADYSTNKERWKDYYIKDIVDLYNMCSYDPNRNEHIISKLVDRLYVLNIVDPNKIYKDFWNVVSNIHSKIVENATQRNIDIGLSNDVKNIANIAVSVNHKLG